MKNVGKTIEIAGIKWKVLDKVEQGYLVITEESVGNKRFGSKNDWRESSIRKFLNGEFLNKLKEVFGELPSFERNLLSMDGQTEYGTCIDKVSLLTVDEYRKYRKHLPNTGKWWWLITPDSTPCNNDDWCVRIVAPSGNISDGSYSSSFGVRPFCIFPFSIFESEEN